MVVVCAQTMWQFRGMSRANGTADINVIMTAEITDEEKASMVMCNEEYETCWFQPEELLSEGSEIKLHPVLRRGLTEL